MENSSKGIKSIHVIGLHEQFDISLNLREDLNIIYGKNGKGKTTILHIIANFLELDIYRFKYLKFKSIKITSFKGLMVEIKKVENKGCILFSAKIEDGSLLNNENIFENEFFEDEEVDLNVKSIIRDNFGGASLYLPAFRAILERVREEFNYHPSSSADDSKIQKLRASERELEAEFCFNGVVRRGFIPARQDPSYLTARKTLQCREWFGQFVPRIRYPSIYEVTMGISNEYEEAMLKIAAEERNMFSEMFVLVLKELLSNDEAPNQSEVNEIIENIKLKINENDEEHDNLQISVPYSSVVDRLKSALQEVSSKSFNSGGGNAERKVLKLYAEMIGKRNENKKNILEKIRKFEKSANIFLDQKRLCVNEIRDKRERVRRTVYVEGNNSYMYDLNNLSSGERQVITMLYSASRIKVASGLFLIDEPELSLHVDWQRRIINELRNMAGGRQIIACTHAPEVGADHYEDVQDFEVIMHSPNNYDDLSGGFEEDVL